MQDGTTGAAAGRRRGAPLLKATVRGPAAALLAEGGIQINVAMRSIVDEEIVADQEAHVGPTATAGQAAIERDPVVATGIHIVNEMVGVRAGKARAAGIKAR